MTDYAELRAALEAGPTPGPWKASQTGMRIEDAEGRLMYEAEWRPAGARKANAAYVAACDPDTIRALLAERDALREALANLVRGYVYTLEGGRDRIVSLGGQCDPVDVMEAADPYLRAARAALAQEQGGSDGGQN